MKKYSQKIIYDYITGNDIIDYKIDDLEDDYEFMLQVLEYTKDKNMYQFCSDKVKKNYEFVKGIIQFFKNDKKFIKEIADEYLEKNNKKQSFDYDCVELNIIMKDIDNNQKNDDYDIYYISTNIFYQYFLAQIEAYYRVNESDKNEYGMGFVFAEDLFASNPKIIEYIAKQFITEIFYENENFTFEELIHNDIKTLEQLQSKKENVYLIEFISKYDRFLSWYVTCHIDLLKEINLNIIKENWNNFEFENLRRKFDLLQEKMEEIYKQKTVEFSKSFVEFFQYILQKYNLEKEFRLLEKDKDFSLCELFETDKIILDKNDLCFQELSMLQQMDKLVDQIFSKNVIGAKEYINYDEEKETLSNVTIHVLDENKRRKK